MGDWQETIRGSYFHLLAVFLLAVFLVSFTILPPWRYNLLFLAVVLGAFGIALQPKGAVRIPVWLLWVALALALVVRILPYLDQSVPLGYDPGMYKFVFDHPFADEWTKGAFPLLFVLVLSGLSFVLGTWFVMIPLYIGLSAAGVLVFYYVLAKLFDRNVGILGAMLFAVSIAQYQNYWFYYYKNVIGILILVVSFLYFERRGINGHLIVIGGLLAGTHQVAFFLFGLTYFVFVMVKHEEDFKNRIITGVLIILLALLVNIDRMYEFLFAQAFSAAQNYLEMSGGAGTFFDASQYFVYTLPFVPFAITGFLQYYRKNLALTIATVISLVIVVFELFFSKRFIIYLDIFVIIYGALGLMVLLRTQRVYGSIITYTFLALSAVLIVLHASDSHALLSQEEFDAIRSLDLPLNATIMATDKYYSPWLKGWVDRPVVAPGLFDDNRMNNAEWRNFWQGNTTYINRYQKPLFIHVGRRQPQYDFDCPLSDNGTKVYGCA
jgi:hypothetical protein